jgi:tRNA(Ile2) C34 agmatinyltransferase TiaS
MSGAEFFRTRMGQKYYDGTMPSIARSLEGIHEELIRQNDLKERELDENASKKELELLAIREFLKKNTDSIPPCPSCHNEHAMYDKGNYYVCDYCSYEVRKL